MRRNPGNHGAPTCPGRKVPQPNRKSGVKPRSSRTSRSTPAASKASTTAGFSLNPAAQCSGVMPSSSGALGSAPASRHAVTSSGVAVSKYASVFHAAQLGVAWAASAGVASTATLTIPRSMRVPVITVFLLRATASSRRLDPRLIDEHGDQRGHNVTSQGVIVRTQSATRAWRLDPS